VVGRDGGRVGRELYSTYDIDTVSSRQWSRMRIEFNSTDGVAMVVPRLISDQNRPSLRKLHGPNCFGVLLTYQLFVIKRINTIFGKAICNNSRKVRIL
jgi:hypothetical protein